MSLSRREFLQRSMAAAVAAGSGLSWAAAKKNQGKNLPNVIFIVTDDQGVSDVEFEPHAAPIRMPNLERLASGGITCSNAYANCPMCAPSRASIMLGGYQQRIGFYDLSDAIPGIPNEYKLAPAFFKEHGYATGIIGKWHLGGEYVADRGPHQKGFDRTWYFYESTHDYWRPDIGNNYLLNSCGPAPIYSQDKEIKQMDYMTREVTKQAIEFIDSHCRERFFLYLAHPAVHWPLQVPKEIYDKYAKLGSGVMLTAIRAMLDVLDGGIGQLLNRIEKHGIADNTLIIYCSDNGGGPPYGQTAWPYQAGKFVMMEGGLRIPMIISWPRMLPKDKHYGYPIMHMDMLPTALAAAGIDGPGRDGINLLPYLIGAKQGRPHDQMFWANTYEPNCIAARLGDWKLVRQDDYVEGLFNLAEDPLECNDLSRRHSTKLAEIVEAYNAWNKQNVPALLTPAMRQDVAMRRKEFLKTNPVRTFNHMFGPQFEKVGGANEAH